MKSKDRIIYINALEAWGKKSQINMMIEECGELITALQHFKRGRKNAVLEVLEELADVEIVLEQMSIIFPRMSIEYQKNIKINRLENRVKESNNEKLSNFPKRK